MSDVYFTSGFLDPRSDARLGMFSIHDIRIAIELAERELGRKKMSELFDETRKHTDDFFDKLIELCMVNDTEADEKAFLGAMSFALVDIEQAMISMFDEISLMDSIARLEECSNDRGGAR